MPMACRTSALRRLASAKVLRTAASLSGDPSSDGCVRELGQKRQREQDNRADQRGDADPE